MPAGASVQIWTQKGTRPLRASIVAPRSLLRRSGHRTGWPEHDPIRVARSRSGYLHSVEAEIFRSPASAAYLEGTGRKRADLSDDDAICATTDVVSVGEPAVVRKKHWIS